MRLTYLSYFPAFVAATAIASTRDTSYVERNFNTIQKIYNLTIYPNNLPIVEHGASAVPAGLFGTH